MKNPIKNISASVKARLMNLAKAQKLEFNRVQLLYVQERFLARLALSPHREHFILKGGLYLYSRYGTLARPTKDMDFLARATTNDIVSVVRHIQEIVGIPLEDGIRFDPESVVGSIIKPDQEYEGVRVNVLGFLGSSRQSLQVDIGFGDAITAGPVSLEYPILLELDTLVIPNILAYSIETVVAEKFEAMVSLGEINTRYKDFYDVWKISQTEALEGNILQQAIQATFKRRGTALEGAKLIFTAEFAMQAQKQKQWDIFRRRTDANAPETLKEILEEIKTLLEPIVSEIVLGK